MLYNHIDAIGDHSLRTRIISSTTMQSSNSACMNKSSFITEKIAYSAHESVAHRNVDNWSK